MAIKTIGIVGAGNVGSYLRDTLSNVGYELHGFNRSPVDHWQPLSQLSQQMDELDLLLLCVSDDAIAELSSGMDTTHTIVAHCSGATDLQQLNTRHSHRAVFYPLMSMNRLAPPDVQEIPFCLEAEQESDLKELEALVKQLGARAERISSAQRRSIHLAAVWAQNFSNHLFYKASSVLAADSMNFSILLPLIRQSVERLARAKAFDLQTGPAIRHDQQTMERHLKMIPDKDDRLLYEILSASIQKAHDEKL